MSGVDSENRELRACEKKQQVVCDTRREQKKDIDFTFTYSCCGGGASLRLIEEANERTKPRICLAYIVKNWKQLQNSESGVGKQILQK